MRRRFMKQVIAIDVSKGKSYLVAYNTLKRCMLEKEKEIVHSKSDFDEL